LIFVVGYTVTLKHLTVVDYLNSPEIPVFVSKVTIYQVYSCSYMFLLTHSFILLNHPTLRMAKDPNPPNSRPVFPLAGRSARRRGQQPGVPEGRSQTEPGPWQKLEDGNPRKIRILLGNMGYVHVVYNYV
jgi:hypothetical protein